MRATKNSPAGTRTRSMGPTTSPAFGFVHLTDVPIVRLPCPPFSVRVFDETQRLLKLLLTIDQDKDALGRKPPELVRGPLSVFDVLGRY